MTIGQTAHADALLPTVRPLDLDLVAFAQMPVLLDDLSVDRHTSRFARALRLGARLEEARHVQPDINADIHEAFSSQLSAFSQNAYLGGTTGTAPGKT